MAFEYSRGIRSRAAILGHPLHPMLVPFPIAFLVGAFVSDLVFAATGDPFWPVMSKWLILAALIMGAAAAVTGFIDFAAIGRVRRGLVGWLHMGGNVLVIVLSLLSLVHRWADPVSGAWPVGFVISAVVAAVLLVTGWLGGELVFRYKIGIIDPLERTMRLDRTPPDDLAARPARSLDTRAAE